MGWSKKEIKHLIAAVVLLAFIFGFNDPNATFAWGSYLFNFIRVAIAAVILLAVYVVAQKVAAKFYGAEANFEVWWIKRYYFRPYATFPITVDFFGKKVEIKHFYVGAILGVIITLVSLGRGFFPLVASMRITEHPKYRAGRKFRHMLDREQAYVSVAGLVSVIVLVLVLTAIDKTGFNLLITMGYYFIGVHLLPFGGLDGGRIFFNSVYLYIITIVLAISAFLLSQVLGLFGTVVLSVLIAGSVILLYLIKNPLG